MSRLDDIIRGKIAAYGNVRGDVVPQKQTNSQSQGNIGGIRSRGKAGAFPTGYNTGATPANDNQDTGFEVQSEPLEEGEGIDIIENKWLRGLTAAAALATASPTGEMPPPPVGMGDVAHAGGKEVDSDNDINRWIRLAIHETGVPEDFMRAVIGIESGHLGQSALSDKGAVGLTQLMPQTAKLMKVDPHDPQQNVLGGARYVAYLAQKYHGHPELIVMGYNMGPTETDKAIRKAKQLKKPVDSFPETQQYIKKMDGKLPGWRNRKITFNPQIASEMSDSIRGVTRKNQTNLAIEEGHGAGVSHFETDLSGKKSGSPDLEDAERKNQLPEHHDPLTGLPFIVGAVFKRYLKEARATKVGVTGGSFQPFHKGHSAVVRKLAASLPKVIIFVDQGGPFSQKTMSDLMKASLSDIWDKIEIYPGQGNLQQSVQSLAGSPGTTLNAESQVMYYPMPEDDKISADRLREMLQDDDKDMVRNMLDPLVSTEPATFAQIYGEMRKDMSSDGQDVKDVITDTPVAANMNEVGAGAMDGSAGTMRGGAHGHSAWSGYNPRGNFEDEDSEDDIPTPPKKAAPGAGYDQYQNMTRSPTTRMTDLTYHGVPNDHMPGDFGQHLDSDDDEEDTEQLRRPTDLNELVIAHIRKIK